MSFFSRMWPFRAKVEKAAPAASALPVAADRGTWFSVFDWRPGAWQADAEIASKQNLLAFSAVFACVHRITSDVAKLRPMCVERRGNLWAEVDEDLPQARVLARPNRWQTRVQFFEQWVTSRLLYGNAYVLKERDVRRRVRALYVLDPDRVQTLVAPDGGVYYRLSENHLAGLEEQVVVPDSEIIHDRHAALWHPLVGVSPIYACGLSATQGRRIQANSSKFFENMSRPSGLLTAPGSIDDVTAKRIKDEFQKNFSGDNLGKLFVAGGAMDYKPMTVNAEDAQLIEQLKWTVEDVARAFCVPLWKLGAGTMPAYGNSELAQRAYYSETLQHIIESIEALLRDGLELDRAQAVEFDLQGLLRMDTEARYKANSEGVRGGWLTPNEARQSEGLSALPGGDTVYLQQQNFSLEALSKRDQQENPFGTAGTTSPPTKSASAISGRTAHVREMLVAKLMKHELPSRARSLETRATEEGAARHTRVLGTAELKALALASAERASELGEGTVWRKDGLYSVGDVVVRDMKRWRCRRDRPDVPPGPGPHWTLLGPVKP